MEAQFFKASTTKGPLQLKFLGTQLLLRFFSRLYASTFLSGNGQACGRQRHCLSLCLYFIDPQDGGTSGNSVQCFAFDEPGRCRKPTMVAHTNVFFSVVTCGSTHSLLCHDTPNGPHSGSHVVGASARKFYTVRRCVHHGSVLLKSLCGNKVQK